MALNRAQIFALHGLGSEACLTEVKQCNEPTSNVPSICYYRRKSCLTFIYIACMLAIRFGADSNVDSRKYASPASQSYKVPVALHPPKATKSRSAWSSSGKFAAIFGCPHKSPG